MVISLVNQLNSLLLKSLLTLNGLSINTDVFTRPKTARGVDWIMFMLFTIPTLVYEKLEENACSSSKPLMKLVSACAITLSKRITTAVQRNGDDEISDLDRLQRYTI